MNKEEYFHHALKAERWRYLSWRLSIFCQVRLPSDFKPIDWDLKYEDDDAYYYHDGKWLKIDSKPHAGAGLFRPNERFMLKEEMWGLDSGGYIDTTYGRALANFTNWYYSFGTRFPYVNENIQPDKWMKKRTHLVIDDDKPIPEDNQYITSTEFANFTQSIVEMKSLAEYITPTGSEITLTTHPEMETLKAELLEKHKDELDVPSVVASITDQLDKLDEEWLKQDESIIYYKSPKARNRRRKLFVIEGVTSAFRDDGGFKLQTAALTDRWKKEELVYKYNETREGSYQRGSETAKGGEKVTFLQSTFQSHSVQYGDCGAQPIDIDIHQYNKHRYIGLNISINKKLITLTDDNINDYVGKTVPMRRGYMCQMEHVDFCEACTNSKFAESPHAIANEEASIGSYIMYGAMSAMHASDLKVAQFLPEYHID